MPIYLKIPGVTGQTQIEGHKDELEVQSFQFGAGLAVTAGTSNQERTAGKPSFSEITVTRTSDSATPQLLQKLASGTVLAGDTIITFPREDKDGLLPLLVITLTDVIISNLSVSSGGDLPSESFSLNYAVIKAKYTKQKEEGGQEGVAPFGWDISKNIAAA
ncbi:MULTISPECIES: type VI secretion system tube protein Hcp [unclassified Variovorax]|jgi:type VI secretion system secreted protein Hcp|uniref:Hcp family type VI secretion system effector n=1 Tax=unclassified Variovorax TaxID=663243 RepID=UPI000F7DAA17|nr:MULTISPECIES: type VI secretion system tube protein Hcp [unclassified Variovorax]RSZ36018.1 type VI secretion system tube protein Hcp [Variovorax sp. 553]RSZ36825.1 type VI secretion system tube protein Hcp [Variovorax sp. 679]